MRPVRTTRQARCERAGLAAIALGIWLLGNEVLAADLGEVLLDRDTVTVGDPITVQMRFAAPGAYRPGRVTWPHATDTLLPLDSLSVAVTGDSNWLVSTRIALFVPGRIPAGPNDILLLGPTGDSLYVLFPPETVSVTSVLPAGEDSIAAAPYKKLIDPPSRLAWWFWLLLLLLMTATAAFLYRLRHPKSIVVARAPAVRPPWEVALERLAQLAERKHHSRGEPRPFAIALSEIVRSYLEARFGFLALEQTTTEIVLVVRHVPLSDAQKDALVRLLSGCDLAKYANYHWPSTELAASLSAARRFVEETTPVAITPAPEAVA